MFKYALLFAFVAYVSAAGSVSKSDDASAVVNTQTDDRSPQGYKNSIDISNSIHSLSVGDAAGNINGEFSWVSPEGINILVSYVADENGYHPKSDLLPTPPPIPAAILKELEYLASHPQKEEKN